MILHLTFARDTSADMPLLVAAYSQDECDANNGSIPLDSQRLIDDAIGTIRQATVEISDARLSEEAFTGRHLSSSLPEGLTGYTLTFAIAKNEDGTFDYIEGYDEYTEDIWGYVPGFFTDALAAPHNADRPTVIATIELDERDVLRMFSVPRLATPATSTADA